MPRTWRDGPRLEQGTESPVSLRLPQTLYSGELGRVNQTADWKGDSIAEILNEITEVTAVAFFGKEKVRISPCMTMRFKIHREGSRRRSNISFRDKINIGMTTWKAKIYGSVGGGPISKHRTGS